MARTISKRLLICACKLDLCSWTSREHHQQGTWVSLVHNKLGWLRSQWSKYHHCAFQGVTNCFTRDHRQKLHGSLEAVQKQLSSHNLLARLTARQTTMGLVSAFAGTVLISSIMNHSAYKAWPVKLDAAGCYKQQTVHYNNGNSCGATVPQILSQVWYTYWNRKHGNNSKQAAPSVIMWVRSVA